MLEPPRWGTATVSAMLMTLPSSAPRARLAGSDRAWGNDRGLAPRGGQPARRPARQHRGRTTESPRAGAGALLRSSRAGPKSSRRRGSGSALPERHVAAGAIRRITVSLHHAAAETGRDGLGAVLGAELAEQPPGVGLDGVLGQVELAADLGVALALAHAGEHLHLAHRQLDRRDLAHGGAHGGRLRAGQRG